MRRRLRYDINSTDKAIEAWDELHDGLHEGDRHEWGIAISLARAMIHDASLRDVIALHIRFCGLPPVVETFLPRVYGLRRQLETMRCRLTDLVESDMDVALLLIRHPQIIDFFADERVLAESAQVNPIGRDSFARYALKRIS